MPNAKICGVAKISVVKRYFVTSYDIMDRALIACKKRQNKKTLASVVRNYCIHAIQFYPCFIAST